jgi:hypothetical protein
LTIHGATKESTAHGLDNADRARRHVASVALDAMDCAQLLEMLGLAPAGEVLTVAVP